MKLLQSVILLFGFVIVLGCINQTPTAQTNSIPEEILKTPVGPDTTSIHVSSTAAMDEFRRDGAAQNGPYSLPEIVPVTIEPLVEKRTFNTKFQRTTYTIEIPVNGSIYRGARQVDKTWPAFGSWDELTFTSSYYSAYISDPQMQVFYDEIMKSFQQIRSRDRLSEEEYIELLVTFVQQLAYDDHAGTYPRYPVEVLYDGKGDCDEKSLLLLGMLSHEGYDVALILLPTEHHAVAGIRIFTMGNPGFRVFYADNAQKYFFIETTQVTYIGLYPEEYEETPANVIPLGKGRIPYNHVNYITHITDAHNTLEDRLVFMDEQLIEWDTRIQQLEGKLIRGAYETQQEYGSDYTEYTQLISQYNDYVTKYNQCREVYLYILEHAFDVEGVYRHIDNSKVLNIDY